MSASRSRRARMPKCRSRLPRLLRTEQLETRTLLTAISPVGNLHLLASSATGTSGVHSKVTPPTLSKAAAATLGGGGKTASLSVLGSDAQGASSLIYKWNVASAPAGGSAVFSLNGSNAAHTDSVTFNKPGVYSLSVTIVDPSSLSVSSTVKVTVAQTLTSISLANGTTKAVVAPGGTLTVTGASQPLTATGLDQFGNPMASQPAFTWTATSYPSGAKPTFSGSGGTETVTVHKVGTYGVSVSAGSNSAKVTDSASIVVIGHPTAFNISQVGGSKAVTGTSAQFTVTQFLDQFQGPLSEATTVTWVAASVPSGAAAPQFSTSGSTTTVTFSAAGKYLLNATQTDASNNSVFESIAVTVNQTLTSIAVTPGAASIQEGATQQFSAQGFDQFQHAMSTAPKYTWTASGGTISSGGLFMAPSTAATYNVTAKSGTAAGGASVTVTAPAPSPNPPPSPPPGGLKDPALASLVAQLDATGSLNRAALIQILTSVGASGTVSATDFSDLKTILADAAQYNMPGYVQVLANDVVNGNAANANYQGAPLGNLAAGSSATQLDHLIDKWFYGTDLPALTDSSLTYETASGSLFPVTPSHNDEYQGELGDCYFISSLGTIADRNPQAVENMFINNGDGTYTVRFYTGTYAAFYNADGTVSDGFLNNACTADYVTVNLSLATYSGGTLYYADFGSNAASTTNSLWIPLAEKAYAQWNETGNEGRNGTNTYAGIEGGWMATVDAQVLGHNATDYNVTSTTEQAAINALAASNAVTIATDGGTLPDGLYGSHAYAVTGYSSSTGLFTLYNPWGFDQPGQLTWSQLESTCEGFVTVNATGSVPISGANPGAAAAARSISAVVHEGSSAPFASTNINGDSTAWTELPASSTDSAAATSATGDSGENQPATIASDSSTATNLAVDASDAPAAAGVDALLASEDLGSFFPS